jgi:predicted metalloprotease
MLWKDRRQSDNIEDRRGMSGGHMAIGGGLGSIVLVVLALLLGADPRKLLEQVVSQFRGFRGSFWSE